MRFYAAQISLALAHLHGSNVVYRDLKPENVLLDQHGNIKLTDFGLSKRVKSFALGTMESSTLTFCGTPEYLSPEMIMHRRSGTGYSKEVDWWALGIVCFELLTGWPPFYDRDFNKMCEKILYKPLIFPTKKYNLTKDAESLIKGLLTRDFPRRMFFEDEDDPDALAVQTPQKLIASQKEGTVNQGSSGTSSSSSSHRPADGDLGGRSGKYSFTPGRNIKHHFFFLDIDWAALNCGQIVPPFLPPMGRDVFDTRNFEKDFTKLPARDSPVTSVAEKKPATNTTSAGGSANLTPSSSSTSTSSSPVLAHSTAANSADAFAGFSFSGAHVPNDALAAGPSSHQSIVSIAHNSISTKAISKPISKTNSNSSNKINISINPAASNDASNDNNTTTTTTTSSSKHSALDNNLHLHGEILGDNEEKTIMAADADADADATCFNVTAST